MSVTKIFLYGLFGYMDLTPIKSIEFNTGYCSVMTDQKLDKPDDAKMKQKAIGRWENEGGSLGRDVSKNAHS